MSKFKFSRRSKKNLASVKPELRAVAHKALELCEIDFVIVCGKRTQAEQEILVKMGRSWSYNSKHLTGDAVDFVPYPVDFSDRKKFKTIADAFFKASKIVDVKLKWGGDWNCNGMYKDEIKRGSYDGGHIQLELV